MKITFNLNGNPVTCDVKINKRLSDFLHDQLGIRSVRASCYGGFCGSCTVLINNKAVSSCLIPAFSIQNKSILTLEGFENTKDYENIRAAFRKQHYTPCSHCFSAKVLSIHALLLQNYKPAEDEIVDVLRGIRCSCDVFVPLVKSVRIASLSKRRSMHGG